MDAQAHSFAVAGRQGIGDHGSDHEQEEGHDDIVKGGSEPLRMIELFGQRVGQGGIGPLPQAPEEAVGQDDHQHIEAAEDIDR